MRNHFSHLSPLIFSFIIIAACCHGALPVVKQSVIIKNIRPPAEAKPEPCPTPPTPIQIQPTPSEIPHAPGRVLVPVPMPVQIQPVIVPPPPGTVRLQPTPGQVPEEPRVIIYPNNVPTYYPPNSEIFPGEIRASDLYESNQHPPI